MTAQKFKIANGAEVTGDSEIDGNINLASGNDYKINDVVVANSSQIGATLRTEVLTQAESDAIVLAIALG